MDHHDIEVKLGQPVTYRIKVLGELDITWSDWLSAESLSVGQGVTVIAGTFEDQVALHSLLEKIRNLGVPLLSVCPVIDGSK